MGFSFFRFGANFGSAPQTKMKKNLFLLPQFLTPAGWPSIDGSNINLNHIILIPDSITTKDRMPVLMAGRLFDALEESMALSKLIL
jgi:hypothetical protein